MNILKDDGLKEQGEWVVEKARAKINLSLDILGRRDDGYHLLKMVMQTLELCDTVTVSLKPSEYGIRTESVFTDPAGSERNAALSVPDDESNLAYRAAALLKKSFRIEKGFDIKIEKKIPVSAGLAGGSSDAAAVLRGIGKMLLPEVSLEELAVLGERIGADVPYCIYGGTRLVEGTGEKIKEISPGLKECAILLIKPEEGISTAKAYAAFDGMENKIHPDTEAVLNDIRNGDIPELGKHMGNSLETPAFRMVPVIKDIRDYLKGCGVSGAMMSGSGSAVFAIDEDVSLLRQVKQRAEKEFPGCRVILTKTF